MQGYALFSVFVLMIDALLILTCVPVHRCNMVRFSELRGVSGAMQHIQRLLGAIPSVNSLTGNIHRLILKYVVDCPFVFFVSLLCVSA